MPITPQTGSFFHAESHSLEHLNEVVDRVALKEIVRETTDVIE
jgi:hypothetical protein